VKKNKIFPFGIKKEAVSKGSLFFILNELILGD